MRPWGPMDIRLKEEELERALACLTYLRFNISAANPKSYSWIMGCPEECFERVLGVIKECVRIKRIKTCLLPWGSRWSFCRGFKDDIIPFAILGRELGVDYAVIKHCSDDETGSLGVDYNQYIPLEDVLQKAEMYSTADYQARVKWSKILSRGERIYPRCYGPAFILQISGSGLAAPCGMLFNENTVNTISVISRKNLLKIFTTVALRGGLRPFGLGQL